MSIRGLRYQNRTKISHKLKQSQDNGLPIPTAHFTTNFSSFEVSNGDFLSITPAVDVAKSSPGVEIRSVQYLWDDKIISTEYSAPFTLNYKLEEQTLGKHTVTIRIAYGGAGYTDMVTPDGFKYEVNVVEKKRIAVAPVFSPSKEIRNGEPFSCEAKLNEQKTTMNVAISKVVFLWDDYTMEEIEKSPFTFEHVFTNETIGKHKLTLHYYVTGEVNDDAYFSYEITIKE